MANNTRGLPSTLNGASVPYVLSVQQLNIVLTLLDRRGAGMTVEDFVDKWGRGRSDSTLRSKIKRAMETMDGQFLASDGSSPPRYTLTFRAEEIGLNIQASAVRQPVGAI